MKGNDVNSPVFRIRLQKWVIYLMLAVIVLAVATILTGTFFSPKQETEQSPARLSLHIGEPAPDFTLETLNGTEVRLSQFRGQPVLINFWASWCQPCRKEMPELVRSYKANKSRGFVLLGMNLTYIDTVQDAQAFAKEFNITFPVLLDKDGAVAEKSYGVQGIPTSVFVNRDGTIARIQIGPMTGPQVDQYVSEILK